jgi:hypothetical protein
MICEQNVNLNEIQKDNLNHLSNTRGPHWNHCVKHHEREIVEQDPYWLNDQRDEEVAP